MAFYAPFHVELLRQVCFVPVKSVFPAYQNDWQITSLLPVFLDKPAFFAAKNQPHFIPFRFIGIPLPIFFECSGIIWSVPFFLAAFFVIFLALFFVAMPISSC